MNYLQQKKQAISLIQEELLPNGFIDVISNFINYQSTIISKNIVESNPNYHLYQIEIPKKAKYLTLFYEGKSFALNPCWISYSNERVNYGDIVYSTDINLSKEKNDVKIQIDKTYKYILIPLLSRYSYRCKFTKD